MLSDKMYDKVKFDEFQTESIELLKEPTYENLMKNAIDFSDGVIVSSEVIPQDLTKYIQSSGKPFLPFEAKQNMKETYTDFYLNKV